MHDTRSAAPPPLSPVVWGASDLLQEQRLHQKPLTWQQQHQQQQQQPALAELAVPQPSAGATYIYSNGGKCCCPNAWKKYISEYNRIFRGEHDTIVGERCRTEV